MLPFPLECLLPDCTEEDFFQKVDPSSEVRTLPILRPRKSRYVVAAEEALYQFHSIEWPKEREPVVPVAYPTAIRPKKRYSDETNIRGS